ncbi:hypothetical protein, partial [Syntrophus gentianae]
MSASVGNLTIAAGNTLAAKTGTALTVYGPTISNAGAIVLNGGGGAYADLVLGANTTLSGGGTLTLNSQDNNGQARIYQSGGNYT